MTDQSTAAESVLASWLSERAERWLRKRPLVSEQAPPSSEDLRGLYSHLGLAICDDALRFESVAGGLRLHEGLVLGVRRALTTDRPVADEIEHRWPFVPVGLGRSEIVYGMTQRGEIYRWDDQLVDSQEKWADDWRTWLEREIYLVAGLPARHAGSPLELWVGALIGEDLAAVVDAVPFVEGTDSVGAIWEGDQVDVFEKGMAMSKWGERHHTYVRCDDADMAIAVLQHLEANHPGVAIGSPDAEPIQQQWQEAIVDAPNFVPYFDAGGAKSRLRFAVRQKGSTLQVATYDPA